MFVLKLFGIQNILPPGKKKYIKNYNKKKYLRIIPTWFDYWFKNSVIRCDDIYYEFFIS